MQTRIRVEIFGEAYTVKLTRNAANVRVFVDGVERGKNEANEC